MGTTATNADFELKGTSKSLDITSTRLHILVGREGTQVTEKTKGRSAKCWPWGAYPHEGVLQFLMEIVRHQEFEDSRLEH